MDCRLVCAMLRCCRARDQFGSSRGPSSSYRLPGQSVQLRHISLPCRLHSSLIDLSGCLRVCVFLSICLSVRLSICLLPYPSVCLSACLLAFVSLFVCLSVIPMLPVFFNRCVCIRVLGNFYTVSNVLTFDASSMFRSLQNQFSSQTFSGEVRIIFRSSS